MRSIIQDGSDDMPPTVFEGAIHIIRGRYPDEKHRRTDDYDKATEDLLHDKEAGADSVGNGSSAGFAAHRRSCVCTRGYGDNERGRRDRIRIDDSWTRCGRICDRGHIGLHPRNRSHRHDTESKEDEGILAGQ